MMAREKQPDPPSVNPETILALQDALRRCLDEGGDIESVRPALHRLAVEARERQILAEQLLISLKDIWHELTPVRRSTDAAGQQKMLQRLVTICIREYYSAAP